MNDNVFGKMIGYKEVKQELLLILGCLQNPQKYQQLGVTPPHNLLLFGAPGVGKTMLARRFLDALTAWLVEEKTLLAEQIIEIQQTA